MSQTAALLIHTLVQILSKTHDLFNNKLLVSSNDLLLYDPLEMSQTVARLNLTRIELHLNVPFGPHDLFNNKFFWFPPG